MRKKAINALLEMGMPVNLLGFKYIVDAMVLLEDEDWNNCKITSLYFKIAKMNNTTYQRVERCIRHAFGNVFKKGDLVFVQKWLTFNNKTSGNLLYTFHMKLAEGK